MEGQAVHIESEQMRSVQKRAEDFIQRRGHRPRIVVAKPGLDGHSNGAEIIAVSARHAGFDVIYAGIRLSSAEITQSVVEENADLLAVSILSGSHLEMAQAILEELAQSGVKKEELPVVFGGIIPKGDIAKLKSYGIKEVFTPSDYDLPSIIGSLMNFIEEKEALQKH